MYHCYKFLGERTVLGVQGSFSNLHFERHGIQSGIESWHRMYLTQPPVQSVEISVALETTRLGYGRYTTTLDESGGVTMGKVFALIEEIGKISQIIKQPVEHEDIRISFGSVQIARDAAELPEFRAFAHFTRTVKESEVITLVRLSGPAMNLSEQETIMLFVGPDDPKMELLKKWAELKKEKNASCLGVDIDH